MKIYCLSAAFVLVALNAIAQESPREYSRALKLYNLTDWERYSDSWTLRDTNFFNLEQSSLRIFHPTIAYQWQSKKGNYHELELISFQLSNREEAVEAATPATGTNSQLIQSEITFAAGLSLRYEYQISIRPKDEKPWDFSVGVGLNPYYFYQRFSAEISTMFPTSVSTFGTRVFAIPRFTWHLSPRVFLDVNLPICMGEYRHQYRYDESPVLQVSERGQRAIDYSLFPALFSGRIGIGIKLN